MWKYESEYNGILEVYDEDWFRFLKCGNLIMGSMLKIDPNILVGYSGLISKLIDKVDPENIFMLGHGVGSLTRKFHNEHKQYLVVEIDPVMVNISKEHFMCNVTNVVIGDGFNVLKEKNSKYDCIVIDIFMQEKVSPLVYHEDFFYYVKENLKDDGYVVFNYIGNFENVLIFSKLLTFFKNVVIYVEKSINLKQERCNYIFVAGLNGILIEYEGWEKLDIKV